MSIQQHLLFLTITSSALLSGCQTMSLGECQTADWNKLGQQDGNAGRTDNIGDRVDSCRKNAVIVTANHIQAYRLGYAQGLGYYCQPQRILDDALAGRNHVSVCPLVMQNNVYPFAQAGQRIYQANQRMDQLQSEQNALSSELRDKKTTENRNKEIRRRQYQLTNELEDAVIELRQARIMLGSL